VDRIIVESPVLIDKGYELLVDRGSLVSHPGRPIKVRLLLLQRRLVSAVEMPGNSGNNYPKGPDEGRCYNRHNSDCVHAYRMPDPALNCDAEAQLYGAPLW
jgi:hypothetical protein